MKEQHDLANFDPAFVAIAEPNNVSDHDLSKAAPARTSDLEADTTSGAEAETTCGAETKFVLILVSLLASAGMVRRAPCPTNVALRLGTVRL